MCSLAQDEASVSAAQMRAQRGRASIRSHTARPTISEDREHGKWGALPLTLRHCLLPPPPPQCDFAPPLSAQNLGEHTQSSAAPPRTLISVRAVLRAQGAYLILCPSQTPRGKVQKTPSTRAPGRAGVGARPWQNGGADLELPGALRTRAAVGDHRPGLPPASGTSADPWDTVP